MVERFGPLAAIAAFLVLGVGLRIALHWRAHGESGVLLFRGDAAHRARGAGLVALVAGSVALGIARAADAPWLDATLAFSPAPATARAGLALSLAGTAALAYSLARLGASWRMGLDERRTELVRAGPYRWTRNPIYLCVFAAVGGLVLALPSWIALGGFVALVLGVGAQVRAEERHLLEQHGEGYRRYAAEVGRWVRWLGRGVSDPPRG